MNLTIYIANRLSLFAITLLVSAAAQAQLHNAGFYGSEPIENVNKKSASYIDDQQVTNLVTTMCEKMGVKNRYIIKASTNISNCEADLDGEKKPCIYYNAGFLEHVKGLSFTNAVIPVRDNDWKTLTILAHELGHHLNQHLLNPEPGMSQVDMELEADQFAGHVLHLLGATLDQAQAAMRDPMVSDKRTYTHPARSERIAAIRKGYDEVRTNDIPARVTNNPVVTPAIKEDDAYVQQQLNQAYEYYSNQNYKQAFPIYYKYREHQLFDVVSQLTFGMMHEWGKGVTQDYNEAVKWYRKSAEQGHASGQYFLGSMYENGKGVAIDIEQAKDLYKKAAAQGDDYAQKACTRLGIDLKKEMQQESVKETYIETTETHKKNQFYCKSAEEYDSIIKANPDVAVGFYEWRTSCLLVCKSDLNFAFRTANEFAERYPKEKKAVYWQARIAAAIDSEATTGLAIPYYIKWISLIGRPDYKYKARLIMAYEYLMYCYFNKKEKEKTREYINKIRQMDPANKSMLEVESANE